MVNNLHEHALATAKELSKHGGEFDNRVSRSIDANEKQEYLTAYFWADLGFGPGQLFQGGVHLPFGKPIGSFYVENHGAVAVVTVSFGSNETGYGVLIQKATGKRLPCPEHITSISVQSNVADVGPVLVVLTTRLWSPATNTSI